MQANGVWCQNEYSFGIELRLCVAHVLPQHVASLRVQSLEQRDK